MRELKATLNKKIEGRTMKEYYVDTKQERLDYQNQYYVDNKKERLDYQNQYYVDNKNEITEYKKQYYLQNKDKYRQRYFSNKDKILMKNIVFITQKKVDLNS